MTIHTARKLTRGLRACALFTLLMALTGLSHATKVRSLDLEELTARAATVFSGRCIEVRTEIDPALGIKVSMARFVVDRAVKGQTERIVTVRTPSLSDRMAGSATSLLPRYREGEEVVLFLYGTSPLGMSSPVGLGQGKLRVARDKAGRRSVIDDLGRPPRLRDRSHAAVPSDLDTLLDTVATMVQSGGAR